METSDASVTVSSNYSNSYSLNGFIYIAFVFREGNFKLERDNDQLILAIVSTIIARHGSAYSANPYLRLSTLLIMLIMSRPSHRFEARTERN